MFKPSFFMAAVLIAACACIDAADGNSQVKEDHDPTVVLNEGNPFDPTAKAETSGPHLELKSGEVTARIDIVTGLLDTLSFGEVEVQPSAANNSVIFVNMGGKETAFRAKASLQSSGDAISAELQPEDASVPFRARAEYRIEDGYFTEKVTLTAQSEVKQPVRLGVRHGFDPVRWDRTICAMYPMRAISAGESTVFSYREEENDLNLSQMDKYQYVVYPLTLLEGPKGILLAGSFDLDRFVTIAPNHPQGYFPSFQRNPKSVCNGETFEFVCRYRFFPKEKYLLRDVWREYAKRIFSRNPLIADFFPYRDRPYRTYFHGEHVGSTFFMESREKRLSPASNIWWFGWLDWETETYPVQGEWWTSIVEGKWSRMSAERMRKEIARLQGEGHKLALYFRQLANLQLKGTLFPEEWYRKKAGGSLDLYGGGFHVKISPEMQKALGYPDIPWGTFNFDNKQYNEFYVNEVKTAVSFYAPKAVGWDMGWRPDHVGMFSAQFQIFDWMRRTRPDMKVVSNECGGGPGLFCSDLAILENGALGGKNEYDFEVMKAFGNAMVVIERVGIAKGTVKLYLTKQKSSWLSEAGLEWNRKYLDFILKKHPDWKEDINALGRLCQLRFNLWDQALGAAPGYLDEMENVPGPMREMARDTIALPLIIESFVVRFPNELDRMAPLFASFWLNEKQARMAVFNDSTEDKEFTLRLRKSYFSARKWDAAQLAQGKVFILTPETTSDGALSWREDDENIIVSGVLPPFGSAMLFCDHGSDRP